MMRNQDNTLRNDNVVETMVEVLSENDVGRFHISGIIGGFRRLVVFPAAPLEVPFSGFFRVGSRRIFLFDEQVFP